MNIDVSNACPWCHRTQLVHKLKGLEHAIELSVVDPLNSFPAGWHFSKNEGCTPDPVHNVERVSDIYFAEEPGYTGRFTVPVLYDRKQVRYSRYVSLDFGFE
jgi:putative glutathione S-transferase